MISVDLRLSRNQVNNLLYLYSDYEKYVDSDYDKVTKAKRKKALASLRTILHQVTLLGDI